MKDFLTYRQDFAAEIGISNLYEVIDHFGLYAGLETLGAKFFTYELLKKTLDVPGDIVEFGCWNGSTLMFLAKALYLHRPNTVKKVIGFDNFSGLPKPKPVDGPYAAEVTGKYEGDEKVLRRAIDLFDLSEKVKLVVGDATETIPEYRRKHPEAMISFAFLDFDLYEPTKAALELLDEALTPGGVVVLDQAGTDDWSGETIAWLEHTRASNSRYEPFSNPITPQPTMAFLKHF